MVGCAPSAPAAAPLAPLAGATRGAGHVEGAFLHCLLGAHIHEGQAEAHWDTHLVGRRSKVGKPAASDEVVAVSRRVAGGWLSCLGNACWAHKVPWLTSKSR